MKRFIVVFCTLKYWLNYIFSSILLFIGFLSRCVQEYLIFSI